jgi:hypothetical protein
MLRDGPLECIFNLRTSAWGNERESPREIAHLNPTFPRFYMFKRYPEYVRVHPKSLGAEVSRFRDLKSAYFLVQSGSRPSIKRSCPVTSFDASEARYTEVRFTSVLPIFSQEPVSNRLFRIGLKKEWLASRLAMKALMGILSS